MSNHVKDTTRPAFVYAVADSTGVRYVGSTVDPCQRLNVHRRGGDGTRTRLIPEEESMRLLILEATTLDDRDFRERFWIDALARKNHPIENVNHNPMVPRINPRAPASLFSYIALTKADEQAFRKAAYANGCELGDYARRLILDGLHGRVRITPEQEAALARIATEDGLSVAELVRALIAALVRKRPAQKEAK